MIRSLGSKETEKIQDGIRSNMIPPEVQKVGRRKLRMINNSIDINDLRIPPPNQLGGDLKSFHSIRINDQWRIMFKWQAGHAQEVEIVDYHK